MQRFVSALVIALVMGSTPVIALEGFRMQQPRIDIAAANPDKALSDLGPARAAAAGDLDGDGLFDLVTAHEAGSAGALVVAWGNADFRKGLRHDQRRAERGLAPFEPFQSAAVSYELPFAPDWVAIGDFDADGDPDVAAVARGGWELAWRRGDGRGGLAATEIVALTGPATALVAGEVNRRDGLTDFVVAVGGGDLLVFESALGALGAAPEWLPVGTPVTDLALGRVDDDGWRDIVAAAGDLVLVSGRDRMLGRSRARQRAVEAPRIERVRLGDIVREVEIGRFEHETYRQVAALRADGVVELVSSRDGRLGHREVGEVAAAAGEVPHIVGARATVGSDDDLVAFGGNAAVTMYGLDHKAKGLSQLAIRAGPPAASAGVLAVRLNRDARDDLVLLDGAVVPKLALTVPRAVFTVNSTADPGDGTCDGTCTLRDAILAANGTPGSAIEMDLPLGSRIMPASQLQALTGAGTTLDGTVGSDPNTGKLVLDGSACGSGCKGLELATDTSTVSELVIGNFDSQGIFLSGDDNLVEGCWIGIEDDGLPAIPNGSNGIQISLGSDNTIGGTTAEARNVSSGNEFYGVSVSANPSGPYAIGNAILGNYIGTDTSGAGAFGNLASGVTVAYAGDTIIGDDVAGAGNVIAASQYNGILLDHQAPGYGPAVLQQNLIGVAADGLTALGNGSYGINAKVPVTVGGLAGTRSRNVIANSGGLGVRLDSGSAGSLVQGNFIGVAADGTTPSPNTEGINIRTDGGHTIGGTVARAANVISGNTNSGIVNQNPLSDVEILGNFIGSDATGTAAVGNGIYGIVLEGCTACRIGEIGDPDSGNVIVDNNVGVRIVDSSGVDLDANRIGLGSDGTALGNDYYGINVVSSVGCVVGEYNIIAHNGASGVRVVFGGITSAANVEIGPARIHSNGDLGIDLLGDGPTPNDPGDTDTGPNNLQNFPVITGASADTGVVTATLDTDRADAAYKVHFYRSRDCDPAGYGEGETLLMSRRVTTDGNGQVDIVANTGSLPAGDWVTAFATDPDGNSSEFSECFEIVAPPELPFSDGFESGDTSTWSASVP